MARSVALLLLSCLASGVAFVGVGVVRRSSGAPRLARGTAVGLPPAIRPPAPFVAAPLAVAGDGEREEGEEDKVDPDAVGVAKMRVSEIKAELDVRGIGYAGVFEKGELVDKLVEARGLGRANPSLIDDFNKENLERKMDPDRAAAFAEDLLDKEKLKDMTAADGTLPGGMTPEMLSKMVSNPELMVLMQNAKLQEIMKKVMAGGPAAMEEMQKDPETAELLQKLEKAMGGIMP